VHTITTCHTETTPDSVSLQVVKALLALVLSSTILVHQSSLLKAVRTVYNVFLMSSDPVNQTVAQGGLTQMVHHVFSRCKITPPTSAELHSSLALSADSSAASSNRHSFAASTPEIPNPIPLPVPDSLPSLPEGSASQGPVTITHEEIASDAQSDNHAILNGKPVEDSEAEQTDPSPSAPTWVFTSCFRYSLLKYTVARAMKTSPFIRMIMSNMMLCISIGC